MYSACFPSITATGHYSSMLPGFFIPKAFLEYDQQFYDSYMELNYALFFLTQAVVAGMIAVGDGGSIVNIGSMWAHQAIGS